MAKKKHAGPPSPLIPKRYQWASGARFRGDAQEVGDEFDRIREDDSEDLLRAETVVSTAKSKTSPLHDHFPWDDRVAAHERRLDVARNLIRSVVVIMPRTSPVPLVKAYLSPRHQNHYRPVERVYADTHSFQEIINEEMDKLRAWAARNRILESGIGEVLDGVDLVLDAYDQREE